MAARRKRERAAAVMEDIRSKGRRPAQNFDHAFRLLERRHAHRIDDYIAELRHRLSLALMLKDKLHGRQRDYILIDSRGDFAEVTSARKKQGPIRHD